MNQPRYFLIGQRLVKLVPLADGGTDILGYEWKTGNWVRSMQYLTQIMSLNGDIEELSEAEFQNELTKLQSTL